LCASSGTSHLAKLPGDGTLGGQVLGNIEAWRESGSLEAVLALAKLNDFDRILTNCTQIAAFYSPPIAHRPLPIDPGP
jgi:hypothetical protein